MTKTTQAVIALGANLGDAVATLDWAAMQLKASPHIHDWQLSRYYHSAPVESLGPWYVNAVAVCQTSLSALDLLSVLQHFETLAGRTRPYHHAPRTLDLDLIDWGNIILDTPTLTLPHPRWRDRAFVIHPLAELLPHWIQPHDWHRIEKQAIHVMVDAKTIPHN